MDKLANVAVEQLAGEYEAKIAACERQVNELAEINKELLEALNDATDLLRDAGLVVPIRITNVIAKAEQQ